MWGSPIKLIGGAELKYTLQHWYFECGNELTGDVAMHPMEGNVVWINVPADHMHFSNLFVLKPPTYNPYTSSFFLFYTHVECMREVTVWGGVTWQTLHQKNGILDLKHDLVQNRAFPLVYEPLPVATQTAAPHPICQWFLPLHLPRGSECDFPSATVEEIYQRMEWVLQRRLDPPLSSTSALALSIFECAIEDDVKRGEFCKQRIQMERTQFDAVFDATITEADVLNMFICNGLEKYLNEAMIEKPTTEDLYWFWNRWNQVSISYAPPTLVFRVAAEECPVPLPLHRRGVVHLTYKEVGAWAWHCFVAQTQKLAFRKVAIHERDEHWVDVCQTLLDGKDAWPYVPKRSVFQRPTTLITGDAQKIHMENTDIEDLANAAPPCIANVLNDPSFPTHGARDELLKVFQSCGVSQTVAGQWFEQRNMQYPKMPKPYPTGKARFDYDNLWAKQFRVKKCETIVRDTQLDITGALHCPFAHSENYQQLCAPHEQMPFSGPHNLIRRGLGRRKHTAVLQEGLTEKK